MTTETESALSFDIIDDRWLDVLQVDGTVKTFSLRELLTDAHEIVKLSESSPLTEVSLLRFLIAFVSDGLRDQIRTETEWGRFAKGCEGGLSEEAVGTMLASLQERSNVLDPVHDAFFDARAARSVPGWDDPRAKQPISRFLPELPTGTNLVHFVHGEDDTKALCVACLLKSRAVDAAFARGGLGPSLSRHLLATIGGIQPRYVIPVGNTLLRSLLLNVVVGDTSRPSWVSVHRANDGAPGPIARMTWRPRLIMPLEASVTSAPCARCGTVRCTRFTEGVMVDTYNHKGSVFGTKGDVDKWKTIGGDPHLLRSEKNALTLGVTPDEWPIRAIVRLLAAETGTILDRLPDRAALLGPVSITVTSSDGNQAKIDDAPHAAIDLPPALLGRSADERPTVASALATIFDKGNRERREKLIPQAVPRLLSPIAAGEEPEGVVEAWLASADARCEHICGLPSSRDDTERNGEVQADKDALLLAARRTINRLARLSARELAALRAGGLGRAADPAGWQAAFEAVWHGLALPSGCRRHAFREALATVAPIYAVHCERHRFSGRRRSFEEQLANCVNSERNAFGNSSRQGAVARLVSCVTKARGTCRGDMLVRLIGAVVVGPFNRRSGSIDFADLLLDLAFWNDPRDPTPARWERLLRKSEITA